MSRMGHLVAVAARSGVLAMAGLLLSGCAMMGYNLGSMLPPDIKTVSVPTCRNQTDEPLIEIECTRALLDELRRDGSLKPVDLRNADAVLHVALINYQIVPLSYQRDRATATEEYRIYITAAIQLVRQSDGKVLAEDTRVRGQSTFEVQGDLTSSKRVGLPAVAEDLAQDIVERVVEYW